MRRFSFVGTFVVVLTLIVGFTWLGLKLVGRSFVPDGEDDATLPGLSAEATITRDKSGIPYISASNENDAMAALGYAHAQDRLWQMDVMRRAGEGRLSQVFGRKTIGTDVMLKTIGFRRVAEKILAAMPARTRRTLEAYCRGVNAYIADHKGRYPMEFDALKYEPEQWKPIHSVLVARLMAWDQNHAFRSDIVNGEIRSLVDSTLYSELNPEWPSYAPTIIPGGQKPDPALEALRLPPPDTIRRDTSRLDSSRSDSLRRDTTRRSAALLDVLRLEEETRRRLGMGGSHVGSNAWALAGGRTEGHKPILANDPHLAHSAPSRWYQAVINYGDRWLAGVTIAGAPFIVVGRNNEIAWGITTMMADETDFYIEKLDSATRKKTRKDDQWLPLTQLRDTIHVADSASVPIVIRIGRHGPIISDVHPYAEWKDARKQPGADITPRLWMNEAISMRWTGAEVTQELAAWQGINNARSLEEFRSALSLGGTPSLDFVYADRSGTIAYVPVARLPRRGAGSPNAPLPGDDSRYDWNGWIDGKSLPSLVNPKEGYVASANNKISNTLEHFVTDFWEDPSRAERIAQLLADGNNFQTVDIKQIQADVVSPQLRYMVDFLIRAFPDSVKQGSAVRATLTRLSRWDGSMAPGSAEAAIVAEWFQQVVVGTFRDELGPTVYSHFAAIAQMPIKSLREMVVTDSRWFDDVSTKGKRETRDDILRKALGRALENLHKRFETWDISRWTFGAMHTVTFPHPFEENAALEPMVNIGPYEVGGSNTTINNGEWNFNNPYEVTLGPSMRQIVDFADTVAFMQSVITTGASGQPLSQFYKNQTILWSSDGYLQLRKSIPTGADVSSVTRLASE